MRKYLGEPFIVEREMERSFGEGDFVFVEDMADLFADSVPTRYILRVLDVERKFPKTQFLHLTKNPERYIRLCEEREFPENAVLGATIETDWYNFFDFKGDGSAKCRLWYNPDISRAEPPVSRLKVMQELSARFQGFRRFISIEPVLEFTQITPTFSRAIKVARPYAVAIGYDNYQNRLPEPRLGETMKLISELETFTTVYRKSLREAWYE